MSPQRPAPPPTPPSASINRIRIVDLPGITLDDEVRGESAYHLLSGPALVRYAQAAGEALDLPQELRRGDPASPKVRREVPPLVDARLGHPDPAVRRTAATIARRLGRNLAYILLALHRGDPGNRAARPDWPAAAWLDWAAVRQVWLGGGLVSGELGTAIVAQANALLAEIAGRDADLTLTVRRAPQPLDMAILGAARYLSPKTETPWHALCLDLGQTSAKRAVATVVSGEITHLAWLPPVPVPWNWRNDPTAGETIKGQDVLRFVAEVLADGLDGAKRQGLQPADRVAISIAAYTRGGMLLGNGIYARMSQLGGDAREVMANAVAERCEIRPNITLVHDGTAAAALFAGEPDAAVIVVGTALGVGFPPSDDAGLLAMSPTVGTTTVARSADPSEGK